ncbi:autotransporter assembly complex protein TamA [Alkalimarinus alittae]|uniref:Translocation and assembly module subunit TamA n=1 Tax=Alkalimarinus alittae TaxID=2961619 RepID=A0ABY6N331_9ALTE|nr:autotransporter assembly complex family protein [Alkalimarinus alittae]UZE96483.1 autotransporter assembly complex protein TamA [Alkalimarinus alittae]
MKNQNSDHYLSGVLAHNSVLNRLLFIILAIFVVSPALASVDIVVTGANSTLTGNVKAHIGQIEAAEFRNPRILERRLNNLITEAVQGLGYYQSEWSLDLASDNVVVALNPGPPVMLAQPNIQLIGPAIDMPAFRDIIKSNALVAGEQLDHSKYDRLKKELMQKAQGLGFFDAEYRESELLVDVQNNTAQINLIMESGDRYQFGEVSFEGSQLGEGFLQSIVPFKRHDPYERKLLSSFRRKLYETGYFSSVTIDTQRIIEDGMKQVSLSVITEDASQHQFEVGFGFDTDNGPRVRFNWDMPVIGTRGHTWNSSIEVSKPEQEISATYRIPLAQPLTNFLLFDTGYIHQEIETTESSLFNVGISKLNLKENNWQLRYGVSADYEEYRQADEDWVDVFYLVPHIGWMRSGFDQDANPSKGYRLWLRFSGSSTEIGADASFFKVHAGARWLTPIGNTNFRLLTRLELGGIATDDLQQVPVSRRFYTGGDQTIRGYGYHRVASRDENGELVGGKFLNVGSVELSGRIAPQWRGAIFTDTGRAYEDPDEAFSSSIGIGARWLSIIGEVRIDLAHPLDDDDTPVKLHISMGPPL